MSGPNRTLPSAADRRAELNGLADHVAAVEAARERLGQDLDQLTVEVRAQMSQTVEKTAWKVLATGTAIIAGIAARKLLVAAWSKAAKAAPPANPAAPETSWGEAMVWTLASGVGVGVARLLAQRGSAAGWQKALGKLPPGMESVTP